jgi:hypothetical protein
MTLYDRYISGQTEQVYQHILALEKEAFSPAYQNDIDQVLTELFNRVAYNLNIIYAELKTINYLFKTEFKYNFERPLHKPLPETSVLLEKLDKAVNPFGFVPLSLKYFYEIVGGVNFVWDYDTNESFMWQLADPIQIASLDAVVDTVTGKYWHKELREIVAEEEIPYLELSADDLHKDNISGGPPYSLEITKHPSVDSLFINEPNNTTFIDYLRICIDNCGFPSIGRPDCHNDYQAFFDKIKPLLKPI